MLLPLQLNLSPVVVPPPVLPIIGTWPGTLPTTPLQTGYSENQLAGNAIRSQMDAGPAKQRNRYTSTVKWLGMVFEMTGAQVTTFLTFYQTTLGNGAIPFDGLPHPRTLASVTMRFDASRPPETVATGWDSYEITMRMEILP